MEFRNCRYIEFSDFFFSIFLILFFSALKYGFWHSSEYWNCSCWVNNDLVSKSSGSFFLHFCLSGPFYSIWQHCNLSTFETLYSFISGRVYFYILFQLSYLHKFFFLWHILSVCSCPQALCLVYYFGASWPLSLYSCLTIIPRLGSLAQPSCVSVLLIHVASSLALPPEYFRASQTSHV